MLNNIYNQTFI